jgi:hypothetical protein
MMKITLLTTATILPFLTGTSLALTPFSDNFNAQALNESRWSLQNFGNAKLSLGKKKFNFTVAKPSGDDYSVLEMKNNTPGFNESWEIILDVSNLAGQNGNVGTGMLISNADDPDDNVSFEFTGKGNGGGFTLIGIADDRDNPEKDFNVNPKISGGSLRVSFDKSTKLFSCWYDADAAKNGFKWKKIATFSPTGKGGDRRANWKMNPGSGRFKVMLFGYSDGKAVKAGKVSFDNFQLKAVR